jgi:hypothetical protein
MPSADQITEEGFGFFRGAWFIGRVPVREAEQTVREEAAIIAWLDAVASTAEDFEVLATAIEAADLELVPEPLRRVAVDAEIDEHIRDPEDAPLDGLEIGVAGLTHALSAIRCLTAASCRSHVGDRTWSDCPVVFFAAPAWRVEILADLISIEGCGLEAGRGMLEVYGSSIGAMNRLGSRILSERKRFRRRPRDTRPAARDPRPEHVQTELFPSRRGRGAT